MADLKKLPITAVMVIYNEEALIERALQSCFDIADEIIVVHDGKCQDKSLEIARKYTDKIYELDHVGEAERHRVFSYQSAKNDWILQLDADEYLSEELKLNMEKLVSDRVDIYEIPWSTFHKGKHYFWYSKRMLFRRSRVYFIGVSHEYVKPIDKNVVIKKTNFKLFHEPLYDNCTFDNFLKKWKKWTQIQAKQFLDNFSDIPKWNCHLSDWEYHRKIRIEHPIIMGMLATPAYNAFFSMKDFLVHRKILILKIGFLALLYHTSLYYYVIILKKKNKMNKSVDKSKYDKEYFKRYEYVDYLRINDIENFGHIYQEAGSVIEFNQNDEIVDLGCGSGQLDFYLYLKYGCDVTGIDYSPDAIYFCEKNLNILGSREKYSDIKNKVRFLHCDNNNLPNFNGVKAIFLIDVVEHLFDKEIELILNKIKEWKGEKGIYIVIKTDNKNYLKFIYRPLEIASVLLGINSLKKIREDKKFHKERHVNLTTASKLRKKLSSLGYKILRLNYPSLEKEIIKAQLGTLGKYKILVWLAFIFGKPLYFLRPSFTILASYKNNEKI